MQFDVAMQTDNDLFWFVAIHLRIKFGMHSGACGQEKNYQIHRPDRSNRIHDSVVDGVCY